MPRQTAASESAAQTPHSKSPTGARHSPAVAAIIAREQKHNELTARHSTSQMCLLAEATSRLKTSLVGPIILLGEVLW